MTKKLSTQYDEIDLLELFKVLWKKKIAIIFITIISVSIAFAYNYSKPESFNNKIEIKKSDDVKFLKFSGLFGFLDFYQEENELTKKNISEKFLERFVNKLMDYNELVFVLKNYNKNNKDFSELSSNEVQALFNSAKRFKIYNLTLDNDGTINNTPNQNYVLNFDWNKRSEGRDILKETLKLALKNFGNEICEELEELLEIKINDTLNADSSRINYLMEQSVIAKELDIADNQVDNINLPQSYVLFNINTTDVAYYLRGYKAIEKEINNIQKRKYSEFEKYRKQINSLKEMNIEWVNYNIYLMDTETKKNSSQLLIIISIFIGLLIGIFYAVISNELNTQKKA